MKISELLKSEITETIDFRGNKIVVVLQPDVYTLKDAEELDRNNAESVAKYIVKGLKDWWLDVDGKREEIEIEKGKKLPITVENLKNIASESFLFQVSNRIESLKFSTAGK
jgi:hypothetical protein